MYLKRPWCWERLRAGGEGDNRGWDGWMASPTRWTWVWVDSGNWWWTGRPGVLQSMGSQRVGHDWVTELNWTDTDINANLPVRPTCSFPHLVSTCPFSASLFLFLPWKKVHLTWFFFQCQLRGHLLLFFLCTAQDRVLVNTCWKWIDVSMWPQNDE